ncbi:MAG: right-handed parallel beta-helix repeat-containing protein [Lysobacteraceae bacterium]
MPNRPTFVQRILTICLCVAAAFAAASCTDARNDARSRRPTATLPAQTALAPAGSPRIRSRPLSPLPMRYTVGGSLNGLGAGKTVVLRNNGGNDLALDANTTFTFTTPLTSGATYAVTVATQPAGLICTVGGGSGVVGGANITNVIVNCSTAAPACTSTIGSGLVAAVGAAPGGSVICLNSSTYASSDISFVNKTSDVTVRPANGATVNITGLKINSSSHLRFTGLGGTLRIAGIDVDAPEGNPASTWMTFDHIEFTEAVSLRARAKNMHWLIDSSTFINIHVALWEGALTVRGYNIDGDQGIVISNNLFRGDGAIDGTDGVQLIGGANGVIVRGNEFTRIDQHPSPSASHADPIQVYGATNIVVDRNYFHDNGGTGGFVDFDGPNSGMVITNNVFEAHRRGGFIFPWAIAANAAQGWLIEHNTIVGGGSVRIDGAASGNIVRNNIFVVGGLSLADGAVGTTTHHHNLNSGYPGAGNLNGNPIFVGGSAPTTYAGYVLAPGSVGRNASSTGTNMGINP